MTSSLVRNEGSQGRAPRNIRLSVVAASRNDDHGGDFIGRFSTFLYVLGHYGAKHRLEAEP